MSHADSVLAPMRRTIETIIDEEALQQRLNAGEKLRIKYGVDLTAPDLHLGHAVNLWLMRHLQEHGHTVVFLLGDLTTRVGDPTGKSDTRPVLSPEAIEANARSFLEQVSLVLDTDPTLFEVRRNSEWFDTMPVADLLSLFSMTTHAQLMARDMFRDRVAQGREIALHELTYPVLQGYDSFAMQSDLTIVGSDQLFNEMMGRQYQQRLGARPQSIITTVITPGLDGGPKQSKSVGNYVALADSPQSKFGKIMSLADDLLVEWASAYTTLNDAALKDIADAVESGGAAARDAKLTLSEAVVARYHGMAEAEAQHERFLAVFSNGATPEDLDTIELAQRAFTAGDLLSLVRPDLSHAARRRLIEQKGMRIDDNRVSEETENVVIADGMIIRTGKRRWTRITIAEETNEKANAEDRR